MKDKIKLGQPIYLKPVGNAARYSTEPKKCLITKVGRKYFETEKYGKYDMETMQQYQGNYSANYIAYITLKDIEDEKEKMELARKIGGMFSYGSTVISLEKLRQINRIIEL